MRTRCNRLEGREDHYRRRQPVVIDFVAESRP
jgi:hypothetical protein